MKAKPEKERHITLKHLYFQDRKWIGIQFFSDKVVQAIIKQLPHPRWSEKYRMVVLPNNQENLTAIFNSFKGVAWVNTRYFFINRPVNTSGEKLSVDAYRKRTPKKGWRYCPEEFYQKLEVRRYSLNTARIYISHFERFINFYPNVGDAMELNEEDIKKYMSHLVVQKVSDSYLNQSINAIKFYYEVVKEMPNRFLFFRKTNKKGAAAEGYQQRERYNNARNLCQFKAQMYHWPAVFCGFKTQ